MVVFVEDDDGVVGGGVDEDNDANDVDFKDDSLGKVVKIGVVIVDVIAEVLRRELSNWKIGGGGGGV